ncbi:transglutaminase family protein [Hoeflea sp. TYP-13]|uniref:transglutaminase family protein n=1 Tax=Hoeflea sp. TYP-13 TaxID=3230023 RepID=UPI0034C6C3A3
MNNEPVRYLALLVLLLYPLQVHAENPHHNLIAENVRNIVFSSPYKMNYTSAKLQIDALIDPSTNVGATVDTLDEMSGTVRKMLTTIPIEEADKSVERLRALKAFLYQPGHWNSFEPFQYDLNDPFGERIENKLLATYLETRQGNCVSMPILLLVLGERLDLDLTLSTAPLHVLVKYTDDGTGKTYNLEATSGAGFTRDTWYQKKSPMSEVAIKNGVYLKKLSRRETLAVMATTVLEFLLEQDQREEAIAVADVLLEAFPTHAYAMVKKGTAYYHLLNENILEPFPDPKSIPKELRPLADFCYNQNQMAFQKAEALGWQMPPD